MLKRNRFISLIPIYTMIPCIFLLVSIIGSQTISAIGEASPYKPQHCIIIDAGHGGIDGGATSCTGVLESQINLEIALRLDDLMHLLGMNTLMIRNTDTSVYTQGDSISAQKVSDLKERVRIVNQTENAVLISIHQNHFSDDKYDGAQVFYAPNNESEMLAKELQTTIINTLNIGSKRMAKKADGIYLMQNIHCPGILFECGFLSNPEEEANLRSPDYQRKLCCVIASTINISLKRHTVS